jgi:hypothetical protein
LQEDIKVQVPSKGLGLLFEASSQALVSIHVDIESLFGFPLYYGEQMVSSSTLVASISSIYQVFGPIYPGKWQDGQYYLKYPGITFVFPVSDPVEPGRLPFTLPNGQVPLLKTIIISKEETQEEKGKQCRVDAAENGVVIVNKGLGIEIVGKGKLNLGTSDCFDIVQLLGPPRDVYFKKTDKLAIHNTAVSPASSPEGKTLFGVPLIHIDPYLAPLPQL